MSKPKWEGAPEWAMYVAQDQNGEWWWYEFEPLLGRTAWEKGGRARPARVHHTEWYETVEFRPMEHRP